MGRRVSPAFCICACVHPPDVRVSCQASLLKISSCPVLPPPAPRSAVQWVGRAIYIKQVELAPTLALDVSGMTVILASF